VESRYATVPMISVRNRRLDLITLPQSGFRCDVRLRTDFPMVGFSDCVIE
jgi:hypothetical protein